MSNTLMPALQAGSSYVIKNLPSVVQTVKKSLPSAYEKAKQTLGFSQTTPEQVAGKAAATNNAVMANALYGTLVKSGVPPQFLRDHYPVLTAEDVAWLDQAYAHVTALERDMSKKPQISGDADVLMGHLVRSTERVCAILGISSEELVDVLAFIAAHGADDIKRYQRLQIGMGRRPV